MLKRVELTDASDPEVKAAVESPRPGYVVDLWPVGQRAEVVLDRRVVGWRRRGRGDGNVGGRHDVDVRRVAAVATWRPCHKGPCLNLAPFLPIRVSISTLLIDQYWPINTSQNRGLVQIGPKITANSPFSPKYHPTLLIGLV